MYAEIEGVALAIVAKVGTHSFKEAGANWYINNTEALVYPQRIFFMRDPFERLESDYSFFVGLKRAGTRYDSIPDSALETWEAFVDFALINRDSHWINQTETALYTGDGKYVPTKIMRFEDVSKWWPLFTSRRLPHENKSVRLVTNSYKGEQIKDYYAKDYAVYNNIIPFDELAQVDQKWPL